MSEPGSRRVVTVLCADERSRPPHMEQLESRAVVRYTGAAGLGEALRGAHALFLWEIDPDAVAEAWPAADRLEWIHVTAAGVDSLLFDELIASPVVVTNARGIFDRPMAEFVLAAVLAFAKRSQESYALQRDRDWRPRETLTVAGSAALVVGTGSIGREVGRLLRAVGMEVRGAGRTARTDDPDFGDVVPSSDLVDHVGWADHLVIAAPLTDSTRGLVDARVLGAMKSSSHLVNVGRGAIVDESALIAALERGTIAGASLDVFETEPLPQHSPLWTAPGVVVTPHMSGDVTGSQEQLARQFLANAQRWLRQDSLENVVDKDLGFVAARPRDGR